MADIYLTKIFQKMSISRILIVAVGYTYSLLRPISAKEHIVKKVEIPQNSTISFVRFRDKCFRSVREKYFRQVRSRVRYIYALLHAYLCYFFCSHLNIMYSLTFWSINYDRHRRQISYNNKRNSQLHLLKLFMYEFSSNLR